MDTENETRSESKDGLAIFALLSPEEYYLSGKKIIQI